MSSLLLQLVPIRSHTVFMNDQKTDNLVLDKQLLSLFYVLHFLGFPYLNHLLM